ncbi:MAG: 50S ribosomal protein L1 [Chloroflexota bacterium]|nr:50S ribosomal protein L1 [Chloroflexota bacterium]
MAQRGKRYQEAAKLVEPDKLYSPDEALRLVKQTAELTGKFDQTIELHARLGIDPRHADQQIRSTATLPAGTGKPVRILVFAQGDAARAATEAGADYVGADDLIRQIEGEWMEFDVAIATPDMMGKVGKLGRLLGRKGLMPNPRSGTIVQPGDLPRTVDEVRKGKVEFRNDRTGLLHVPIGKSSFSEEQLRANLAALIDAIQRNKPTGAKGIFVRSLTLTSTMGPGIRLDIPATLATASQTQAA